MKSIDELESVLKTCIAFGQSEGFSFLEAYEVSEPLSYISPDVKDLDKPQLLTLLDQAIWAITGACDKLFKVEEINSQGRDVSEASMILSEKMAAYQKPFADKGMKFTAGRKEGAVSIETKHIQDLLKQNPKMKAKELLILADDKIIDRGMPLGTFKNKVTTAKKKLTK